MVVLQGNNAYYGFEKELSMKNELKKQIYTVIKILSRPRPKKY